MQFFMRWSFAGLLVAMTYNPTPWNYLSWFARHRLDQLPLAAVMGLALAIGYVVTLRATVRALGLTGVLLVLGLVAAVTWLALDQGWLTLQTPDGRIWLAIFAASAVLGIGLSWSMVRGHAPEGAGAS
ncbi:hypothetical protein GZA08_11015 [Pseudoroseicyclus sp. CLL3-39]|uniref:Uncharacterized protein n=1 Tax=Pseudoroseicyclus tamaricis TaxID=2705421 RepID=A0A6B2JU85_9RHOB|nr:hypothetical protein [Pseudoroseicyclus tamaricis]